MSDPALAVQTAIYTQLRNELGKYFAPGKTDLVTNGDFSSASGWTLGAGWAINGEAYMLDGAQAPSSLSQTLTAPAYEGVYVSVTVGEIYAGSLSVSLGGASILTGITAAGTYYITSIITAANPVLSITANADFMGDLSGVSAKLWFPVYDGVPQDAAYPYVTFDFQDVSDRDMLNKRMDSRTFYLAVWSDYRGQREVLDVMAAMDAALHEKRLALSTGRIAQMRVLSKRTNREPDGVTYMGQLRLQVLTEH